MARIVRYREFLKKGAGNFVRNLDSEYIIVSNRKVAHNSFVVLKADALAKIFEKAGMVEEKNDIENALKDIKESISEKYRKVRSLRNS